MATQLRRPTGEGSPTSWGAVGAATVWECVDEAAADDDTTYGNATAFARHNFTYSAFDISSSAITDVTTRGRAERAAGGGNYDNILIVNGSIYGGTPTAMALGTYSDFSDTWATNPDTGSAWLEADVEGTGSNPLQSFDGRFSGVTGGSPEMRCTQTSIEVNYTASGTVVPSRTLMGVGT